MKLLVATIGWTEDLLKIGCATVLWMLADCTGVSLTNGGAPTFRMLAGWGHLTSNQTRIPIFSSVFGRNLFIKNRLNDPVLLSSWSVFANWALRECLIPKCFISYERNVQQETTEDTDYRNQAMREQEQAVNVRNHIGRHYFWDEDFGNQKMGGGEKWNEPIDMEDGKKFKNSGEDNREEVTRVRNFDKTYKWMDLQKK